MKMTLDYTIKVWYPFKKAEEFAYTLQKGDAEWNYVVHKSPANDMAYIEVLDTEGYFLGYM